MSDGMALCHHFRKSLRRVRMKRILTTARFLLLSAFVLGLLGFVAKEYLEKNAHEKWVNSEEGKAALAAEKQAKIRNYSRQEIEHIISYGQPSEVVEVFKAGVCSDCSEYVYYAIGNRYNLEIISAILSGSNELVGHKEKDGSIESLYGKAIKLKRYDVAQIILSSGKESSVDCKYFSEDENIGEDDAIKMIGAMRINNGYRCVEPDMLNNFIRSRKEKVSLWLLDSGVKTRPDVFWAYASGKNTSIELFHKLLQSGADINFKKDGLTPLDGALVWYRPTDDRIEMWMQAGAVSDPQLVEKNRKKLADGERDFCRRMIENWNRGLSKKLAGEEPTYQEDRALPEECRKY